MTTTFSTEIQAAVLRHMNSDHTDDNLLIVRALVPQAVDAVEAEMTAFDGAGGDWIWTDAEGTEGSARVPWSVEISERAEVRREIVVLYDTACERLGVAPRPH